MINRLRQLTNKQALQSERAGALSKLTADTVGQVGGLLGPHPLLTRDASTMLESDSKEQRELAEAVAKLDDPALEHVMHRRGGYNLLADMEHLYQNPRTSLLAKTLGTGLLPLQAIDVNTTRTSHYNPLSNTVVTYGNNPDITLHVLGHAQNYNSRPLADSWQDREREALQRDG